MGSYYMPGVCNINDAEVSYRRNAGHFFTAMSVVLVTLLVIFNVSPVFGLTVIPSATIAALQYLQVKNHFCVSFAASGVYSSGPDMGETKVVTNTENAKLDKARAKKMNLKAVLLASVIGILTLGLLVLI